MGLLAGTLYDPAAAVTTKSVATLIAMTAIDTTNLRLTFTVPANGRVLVKQRVPYTGNAGTARLLFGVMNGATVTARVTPTVDPPFTGLATHRRMCESVFVVPGLTPGASLTWDAAYGVEVVQIGANIPYGGPNNTVTNDAWGGYSFEIYDCPQCIGAILYDPAVAVNKSVTALLAMTAFDTTNARITFTVPNSGKILWRVRARQTSGSSAANILFGVMDGATVKGRVSPLAQAGANSAFSGSGLVTGLTPRSSLSYDAAYSIDVLAASGSISYGGPDDTTTNNAFGALGFEIWEA